MNAKKDIENNIQKAVDAFWEWALKTNTKVQVKNGEIDSPAYSNWRQIESILEKAFKELNFEELSENTFDNIIFLIAQQWDIGIILNWFNKGGEEIGQLGMTQQQLKILCKKGLKSELRDAKSQFAASLYKIKDKKEAIQILLKYHNDDDEYIRRCSLQSLFKLKYRQIDSLVRKSWKKNEEHEQMLCLQIWSKTNEVSFKRFSKIALSDKRQHLSEYAKKLIDDTNLNKISET